MAGPRKRRIVKRALASVFAVVVLLAITVKDVYVHVPRHPYLTAMGAIVFRGSLAIEVLWVEKPKWLCLRLSRLTDGNGTRILAAVGCNQAEAWLIVGDKTWPERPVKQ